MSGLDIGIVGGPGFLERVGVCRHPVQDEAVETLAGPGVVNPQRFENEQRSAEAPGPLGGALETVVEPGAASRCHPIDDVGCIGADLTCVLGKNPGLGNRCVHAGSNEVSSRNISKIPRRLPDEGLGSRQIFDSRCNRVASIDTVKGEANRRR